MSLPQHPVEFDTLFDGGEDFVWVYCPSCGHDYDILSWDQLEAGEEHECPRCGYQWQVAKK